MASVAAKTVLITGASRGIGLGLATHYKALGYIVIGTARDPATATDLKALGVADIYPYEASNDESIAALVEHIAGRRIDLLINNAGVAEGKDAREEMLKQYSVNSVGPYLTTNALLPSLLLSDAPRVVVVSSGMGSIGETSSTGYAGYRMSKAAANMAVKLLSVELKEQKVAMLSIHPGYVET